VEIDNPEVDAGIAEEADDVVRILTIHGAKGLEFPIVVLGGLSGRGRETKEPLPEERERQLHLRVGSGGRTGHYATPGYDERWEHERAALDAERVRLLYVAATRARDHLVVPCVKGKGKPGPFLELLEPLLPEAGAGHEVAVDGAWLLDAAELQLPPHEEQAAPEAEEGAVARALEERSTWQTDHAAALREARRELPFVVASSVERATRPLASEASSASSALLLSEGPPLPVGDALHLVMERVSLPGATDLDDVVESVCAEAGLLDRTGEVQEMATRCLSSEAVRSALACGTYWREVPFTVTRDGGFAVGRVDLVYRDRDALVVVDYKSDEIDAAQVEGHARTHHAGQAEAYADALARSTGCPVRRVVFVFPRAGSEVSLRVGSGAAVGP
jgi:ATP-dependent helicase/nuclease subunit A